MKIFKSIVAFIVVLSLLILSVSAFSAETYRFGDVNRNKDLDISDVTLIQQHLAKIIEFDAFSFNLADFTRDGKVSISDATAIQLDLVGLYHTQQKTDETEDPDSYRLPVVFED